MGREIVQVYRPYVGIDYLVTEEPKLPKTVGLVRTERSQTHLKRYILRESARERISGINNIRARAQIGRVCGLNNQ